MADDTGALETRIARLEDERDILDTMHRYAHTIDYHDHAGWVACFTPDALYDVRFDAGTGREADSFTCQGHDELARFVEGHGDVLGAASKHVLVEPRIEVDGDTATATSYFEVLNSIEGMPVLRTFGRYRDRFARTTDGWLFAERRADIEASAGRR